MDGVAVCLYRDLVTVRLNCEDAVLATTLGDFFKQALPRA